MAKIKKAPGATKNTYMAEVSGLMGFLKDNHQEARKYSVMFTSDDAGETLSVKFGDRWITLPFEEVQELMDHAREERKAAIQ